MRSLFGFSSVQLNCSVMSNSLRPHEWQHARPLYPLPTLSPLKLTSIESVMPSNHFILCHLLLLLPPIPPSLRVFSNESALPMRWPKYNPSPNLVGLTRCLMCTRCLPPHHRCFSMLPVCLTALVPLQVYSTTVSFPFCPFASSLCSLPLCRCGHVLPLTETDQEGPAAFTS